MTRYPRVLTVGTGAIGAIYSWRLAQSCEITALCRSNYQIVSERGFDMNTEKFGQGTFRPYKVVRTLSECAAESFDYVVVTLKALPEIYDVPDMIAPVIKNEKTAIVLIQNGLGIESPFAERFPNNPIISIVAFIGSSQHEPGKITMTGDESLAVGGYTKTKNNPSDQQSMLVECFKLGSVNVQVVKDIEKVRWEKLFWTAGFSPVCTLTGMNSSQVFTNDDAMQAVKRFLHDLIIAADADGYYFDEESQLKKMISRMKEMTQNYKPSMQLDRDRGSPMEVEVTLGTALKRAKAKGLHVPQLEVLYYICNATNCHIINKV